MRELGPSIEMNHQVEGRICMTVIQHVLKQREVVVPQVPQLVGFSVHSTHVTQALALPSHARKDGQIRLLARILTGLIGAIVVTSAFAQSPRVQFKNISRPDSSDFKMGDRFEMRVTGLANQPVSVRTMSNGRTDWSPVIAHTDQRGEWSTTGTYSSEDFGNWMVVWTVGGKLALPVLQFSVEPACLANALNSVFEMGAISMQTCDTATGRQSFVTPSFGEPFHTPDGRTIPGLERAALTVEQYKVGELESVIVAHAENAPLGWLRWFGDEAATLMAKTIGDNALREEEVQHVLTIVHAAFARRDSLQPELKNPVDTLPFLQKLAKVADQNNLKQQIAATIDYVQN